MRKIKITEEVGVDLVIIDLDLCVFDTFSLPEEMLDPVLSVFRGAKMPEHLVADIVKALWSRSLDDVVRAFGLPESVAIGMREVYANLDVPDCVTTYGDEHHLAEISQTKILVTSGFERFQLKKVEKVGVGHLFDQIIVDAIDRPAERKGKKRIFLEIIDLFHVLASRVLVVGDSGTSELLAGKELGMITVQTLRPKVEKWPEANFHIESFSEL